MDTQKYKGWGALFTRKSVADLRHAAGAENPLERTLGPMDLALLGIGCIMGTGIFVLTGQAAATNAGPAVFISFAIAGFVATLGALCYAEMASMIPVAGSAYTYAYATMGEAIAFIIGWDLLLEWLVGAAAVSVGWSAYAQAFAKSLFGVDLPAAWANAPVAWDAVSQRFYATGHVMNVPAAAIVLACSACLLLGIRESARANRVVVFIKVAVVLIFLAVCVRHIRPELWTPLVPPNLGTFGAFGISGIFQAATMVFFAYLGFDAVSVAAQETKHPARDVPIGIIVSLVVCTVLYMAMSLAMTGLVPFAQLGVAHPVVLAVRAMNLPWLEALVEVGAIAGLTSVVLVQLFAQSRILYTMACDGFLPRIFTRLHARRKTPTMVTALTGAACAVAAALLPIGVLAEMCSIGTLLAFVLVAVGVTLLRRRDPGAPRGFKVPGGAYLIPVASAAASCALMASATTATIVRLMLWMLLGGLIYYVYGRKHAVTRKPAA